MPKKQTAAAPWQALEEQAYHAYREWPLWLVLRARELTPRRAAARPNQHTTGAAPVGERTERAPEEPAAQEGAEA